MFFAGADGRLHDRMQPVGYGGYAHDRGLRIGGAAVAGKFGHGLAVAGLGVFGDAHMGQDFAFDDVLRPCQSLGIHSQTGALFHGPPAQRSGDGQFVEADGRHGRLEARAEIDGGIKPDADGHGQRLARGLGLGAEHVDVAARREPDGQGIRPLQTHAVDGHVLVVVFRIFPVQEAHRDIRPGVLGGIGGRGDEAAQIKPRLVGAVHGFLTRGNSLDGGRLDEVLKGIHEVPAEALRLRAEQQGGALAAGEHADGDPRAGMSLHLIEKHGRADAGGAGHRAARADMPVCAAQFRHGIGFDVCLGEFAVLVQQFEGGAQICNIGGGERHGKLLGYGGWRTFFRGASRPSDSPGREQCSLHPQGRFALRQNGCGGAGDFFVFFFIVIMQGGNIAIRVKGRFSPCYSIMVIGKR